MGGDGWMSGQKTKTQSDRRLERSQSLWEFPMETRVFLQLAVACGSGTLCMVHSLWC